MRRDRKGATLVELMFLLFLLAVVAVVCGGGCLVACGVKGAVTPPDVSSRPTAEENAAKHFAFTYEPDEGTLTVECDDSDPERDGYVICKGDMKKDGLPLRYVAECSGNWQVGALDALPNPGCRSSP